MSDKEHIINNNNANTNTQKLPLEKMVTYRNIGIAAHVDAGKTTVTEKVLFYTGVIHRPGEVHDGNTIMDHMEQERERGITIASAATTCVWQYRRINIIDTPGHVDFTIEVERSLRVLDGCVTVFDAASGVEPQSETVWRQANKYKVPRICFINKMDKDTANFDKCIKDINYKLCGSKKESEYKAAVINFPNCDGEDFHGIIDVVREKYYVWTSDDGSKYEIRDVPENFIRRLREYRDVLISIACSYDDNIGELFIEDQPIASDMLIDALRKAVLSLTLFPITCGSAYKNKGIQPLLDAVIDYLPAPDEREINYYDNESENKKILIPSDGGLFVGLAFKTIADRFGDLTFVRIYSGSLNIGDAIVNRSDANKKHIVGRMLLMHANSRTEIKVARSGDIVVIAGIKDVFTGHTLCDAKYDGYMEKIDTPNPVIEVSIEPHNASDQDLMLSVIRKLCKEDPSLQFSIETNQVILKGMGELHLEVVTDRILSEFKIDCRLGAPAVAFRETIAEKCEVDHIHKKQTGGAGQFARISATIRPNDSGGGIVIEDKVTGGRIPKEFIPSIEKGVKDALQSGHLKGYPVVDCIISINDGAYHDVDSSCMAFEIAGRDLCKKLLGGAHPTLLEPCMKVMITTPDEYQGDINGHVNKKRGIINSIVIDECAASIEAIVPLSEMFGYVGELRSSTKGRGIFSMEFDSYRETKLPD